MSDRSQASIVPAEVIEARIYLIRSKKVMLDRDLAALYGVQTKVLNQAVKRNIERFPDDFMFQLTRAETQNWKSQIVTSNPDKMGWRKCPYAFTEQGVSMLSSVLHSPRAIQVNIQIMRTFTRMKQVLLDHKALWRKIDEMEKKYDQEFQVVFEAIRKLLQPQAKKSKPIGFHVNYD